MKLNFRTILLGGVIFYAGQWVVGMISGVVIHEGVLEPLYMANAEFWRPELNQDPPDMAALMPRWIGVGLTMAFIMTAIFDNIRSAFTGSALVQGVKYGFVLGLLQACFAGGWSGVFNLPDAIWMWWVGEGFAYFIAGGAALGWYVGKFARD